MRWMISLLHQVLLITDKPPIYTGMYAYSTGISNQEIGHTIAYHHGLQWSVGTELVTMDTTIELSQVSTLVIMVILNEISLYLYVFQLKFTYTALDETNVFIDVSVIHSRIWQAYHL